MAAQIHTAIIAHDKQTDIHYVAIARKGRNGPRCYTATVATVAKLARSLRRAGFEFEGQVYDGNLVLETITH